jgi:hypothetical protein
LIFTVSSIGSPKMFSIPDSECAPRIEAESEFEPEIKAKLEPGVVPESVLVESKPRVDTEPGIDIEPKPDIKIESALEDWLCHRCSELLRFDDAALGGYDGDATIFPEIANNHWTSGRKHVLVFDKTDSRHSFTLPFYLEDTLPELSLMRRTADEGCTFAVY